MNLIRLRGLCLSTFGKNRIDKNSKNPFIMFGATRYFFLSSLLGMLLSVALVNYLIDPYGRYGTDILNSRRIDPRSWIVNKLHHQVVFPHALLFGSSRCLSLNPNYGYKLTGVNVALYAGAMEDHYCILRYAVDELKYPVRVAVIGLEPDLLVNAHPVDIMLKRNKMLGKYLEKKHVSVIQGFFSQPIYLEEVASLLSLTTLMDSGRVLFHYLMKKLNVREASASENNPEQSFASDIVEAIVENKDSMEARLRQYKKLYGGAVSIDPERVKYIYRFAEFAKRKGIRVVIFFPGYSKSFWDEMAHIDSFLKMHSALDAEVQNLTRNYGWGFIDFRPGRWKGVELVFFDGVHPTKQTARIISQSIEGLIKNGF